MSAGPSDDKAEGEAGEGSSQVRMFSQKTSKVMGLISCTCLFIPVLAYQTLTQPKRSQSLTEREKKLLGKRGR